MATSAEEASATFSSSSAAAPIETPVLIVGGSLVGLSTALLLRWHGVDSLTVERHAGTAIHPRAGHFQLRTVEILRSVGLEDAVRRKSEEQYFPDGVPPQAVYRPGDLGDEKTVKERLEEIDRVLGRRR